MSGTSRPPLAIRSGAAAADLLHGRPIAGSGLEPLPDQRAADLDRDQGDDARECFVCGGADDGACHGVDGERAECPWY